MALPIARGAVKILGEGVLREPRTLQMPCLSEELCRIAILVVLFRLLNGFPVIYIC